ncbi:hypothetical protein DRJ17_00750 [Candidatus Woesearchaeota archaeon]|nr:MAG: hypothetical protein DRJ17_00750 [Candidatus Woesearchaeota archaeon]
MSDQLIQEINSFISLLDVTAETLNSKELIDSFIAHNDATVQEINQFIELIQDFEENAVDQSFFKGRPGLPRKQLPDAAFAVVEETGKKDEEGRTIPDIARHLPHHTDAVRDGTENDTLDIARYRNALARVSQIKATQGGSTAELIEKARKHLESHREALNPPEDNEKLIQTFEETENEVTFLLEEPSAFLGNTFKRRNLGNGISIILGMLKDVTRASLALQSFRFSKKEPWNWTIDRAKAWLQGRRIIENQELISKHLQYVKISDVKIEQVLREGTALRITGIAISEGTWNGIFYPAEELKKGHKSLEGKPLRIDHSSSTRDIVGKVIKSTYNPHKKWIEFEAIVTDEDIAQKLLDKLIDSVSVGVLIDNEEEDGRQVARNLEFKELSLVDDPACKDAKVSPVKKK